MKVLSNFRFLFMVAAASFMLVSCSDDLGDGSGGGGGSETQTSLNLEAGPDLVTSVTTVAIGDTFIVNLVATAGDDALNTLQVFEDGVSIVDFGRIKYNDDAAVANPVLLLGDSKTSLDVDIKVASHLEAGTRTYRFTVVDDAGDAESVSVDVTTAGTPPALTLIGTTTQDITIGSLHSVNLTAVKGTGSITSIGVSVDGVDSDIADLEFDGIDFTSNPHILEGDLVDGFESKAFTFRAPMTAGSYLYTITLTDQFGQESTTEFTANVTDPVTVTPVDMLTGVLFNSLGPAGTGGLDLDNGMSTGSSDDEAEIKDLGNNGTSDWAQQIAPANGSKLYLITPGEEGVAEDFSFGSLTSKEALAAFNGSGLQILESGTVFKDQVYVVERDGNVYAFEVTEVNVIQADNSDNYRMNIIK